MGKGMTLRSSFRSAEAEVNREPAHHHVGIPHDMLHTPHAPSHHNDNAVAHTAAKNYASIGHFIDWLRETHAYQKTAMTVDDLMRKGLMKTMSYFDLPGHLGRELAVVPSRARPRAKDIALDSYEHD